MNISERSESSDKYLFWTLTASKMMPQKRTDSPQIIP